MDEYTYFGDLDGNLNSSILFFDCENESRAQTCFLTLTLVNMSRTTTKWINLILILVGFIVNLLVVLVFCRVELRKLSISIHTVGLAVSDMMLLCFPIFLRWLHENEPNISFFHTKFWCQTHGYFDIVFCCCSSWNVVGLSNERWMAICRPSKIYVQNAKKRALIIVTCIPIIAFLIFIWYPLSIRQVQKRPEEEFKDTEFYICQNVNQKLYLFLGTSGLIMAYLIPFILISFFNSRIVKKLNDRIQKRKEYFGNGIYLSDLKIKRSDSEKKRRSRLDSKLEYLRRNINESANTQDTRNSCSSKNSSVENLTDTKLSMKRRNSRRNFSKYSTEVGRRSSTATSILNGKKKRSSGANTEILRARERMNQYQRVKNDGSINFMLITVSVSFLALTFPYQIIWAADQLYRLLVFNENVAKRTISQHDEVIYELVSATLKDIALTIRNLNFSMNFFLYSTMSNLFRRELNILFQSLGFYNFILFKNSLSTTGNNFTNQLLTPKTPTTNQTRFTSFNVTNQSDKSSRTDAFKQSRKKSSATYEQ